MNDGDGKNQSRLFDENGESWSKDMTGISDNVKWVLEDLLLTCLQIY